MHDGLQSFLSPLFSVYYTSESEYFTFVFDRVVSPPQLFLRSVTHIVS